jgi:voltage-gated potassium channel
MGIEGWSFLESLYMTILTFTTVGYDEVHPLSAQGRIFTTFLMLVGVATMLYTLTTVVQYVVEEEFVHSFLRRNRMVARLSRLNGHFIVCGFGRVGQSVAESFLRESVPVVVIDTDPDALARATKMEVPFVQGSATEDDTLRAARIDRAKGLVAALGADQDNVFVTLSARGLNQDLQIVARASRADSITNLDRAGADHVISPHQIGGLRMAMSATRPLVVDFLDSLLMSSDDDSQHITEVLVTEGSPLSTGPIGSVCAPLDVHVLAIRRGGEIIVYPDEDQTCLPGDSVILVGVSRALSSFEGRSR